MGQQRKLVKVIWAFDVIGQRTIIIFLPWQQVGNIGGKFAVASQQIAGASENFVLNY